MASRPPSSRGFVRCAVCIGRMDQVDRAYEVRPAQRTLRMLGHEGATRFERIKATERPVVGIPRSVRPVA